MIGTTRRSATATGAAERLGIEIAADNASLARASDVIVLAVKPYQAKELVQSIAAELTGKLLVSVCASVSTAELYAWSGNRAAVVRAMPAACPALPGR